MVLDRDHNTIEHRQFHQLPDCLSAGDLLVLNETRVIPARLIGRRESSGGKWEGLFLREHTDGVWELLARAKGQPIVGEAYQVEPGPLRLIYRGRAEGHWLMTPEPAGTVSEILIKHGQIPLPPYIRQGRADDADRDRYQTVFARTDGSVAAPTAGLHFTPALLARLEEKGVNTARITLHVGLGTFEPMRTDNPDEHVMHAEWAEVSAATVSAIQGCKARGNRVFAVGTTAVRALESAAREGELKPWSGETNLFIRPPYQFHAIDGMITNFHLPRTTLLLLVSALAGTEFLQQAYRTAITEEYRFYSYGDAMLIH